MATFREQERTYEVPDGFSVPLLADIPGVDSVAVPNRHSLTATYYDTPDLALARHRISLRRRTGGPDQGWHLKRAAGVARAAGEAIRDETRYDPAPATVDGGDDPVPVAMPGPAADDIWAVTRGRGLVPVATVRTERTEWALRDSRDRVLATVTDDHVDAGPDGPAWREIEVELGAGPAHLLDGLDRMLRAAGARPAAVTSKLARALGDRYPAPPPPDGSGAAGALAGYLRAQRDALLANDPGVRKGDADAVHDMRVASRRLRATLRTFAPLLAPDAGLGEELHALAGRLGDVRDGDVLADRLGAAVAAEPPDLMGEVAGHLGDRLAERTAIARGALSAALTSQRYGDLLDRLDRYVADPLPGGVSWSGLRRRVRHAVARADRRLDQATDDAGRHRARRAYKRARYAVEVLRARAGRPARRLAKRLTRLQDALGARQDAIVTRDVLRELAGPAHAAGQDTFGYGVLYARQDAHRIHRLNQLVKRARRGRVRHWLG